MISGKEGYGAVVRRIWEKVFEDQDLVDSDWEYRVSLIRGVAQIQCSVEGSPVTYRLFIIMCAHFI